MRRHSHESVESQLLHLGDNCSPLAGAAAATRPASAGAAPAGAVAAAAGDAEIGSSSGFAASADVRHSSAAPDGAGKGLELWEGLLVTGRKGLIRGVDCSALDAGQQLAAKQQQLQQFCLNGTIARVPAQSKSVCESLGPTVGYWD